MESRSGRLAMVAAARRHRRAVGGGDARRQMGRRATGGRAALRPPSPAGRHPHLVGPCRRRRDPANLRHEYDHTGAHRPRPRPPLSGRQGRRGHRCARPRDGPQAGRCRDARRTLPGSRGIRNARIALDLVDPGAESPRETWLRLLLIRAGFPRPQTQIPVYDEYGQLVAVIDMGWAGIKVGVDYEGDHHRTDRRTFNKDIKRAEALTELGWTDVRVTVEDTEGGIIWRVSAAWQRRT